MDVLLIPAWRAVKSHPQFGGFYTQNKISETLKKEKMPDSVIVADAALVQSCTSKILIT